MTIEQHLRDLSRIFGFLDTFSILKNGSIFVNSGTSFEIVFLWKQNSLNELRMF